jgi:ubiquinone/menaquinone biosynthesis C-methylase UbiE
MSIIGVVDTVSRDAVAGWVYSDDAPDEHLTVTVVVGATEISSIVANGYRPDLQRAGKGNGDHAFQIKFKPPLSEDDVSAVAIIATTGEGAHRSLPLPKPAVALPNLDSIHPGLKKVLKYGKIFADAAELYEGVGYPADFIDEKVIETWFRKNFPEFAEIPVEAVIERIRRDDIQIPNINNREGYAPGADLIYWLSGFGDHLRLQALAEKYGVHGGRYFDFGGSTGRVFRHFATQGDWEVWSSDFKITSVEFNLKHFPTNVRVFLNTALPALPLPDAQFDLISACSVFTHINEGETPWLLELRRILKIGGVACLSIHDKQVWADRLLHGAVEKYRPDLANQPVLPEGKTVVTFRDDDPYNCHTFQSDSYIHRNWGRFFEICDILPRTMGPQAIVVCRRVD